MDPAYWGLPADAIRLAPPFACFLFPLMQIKRPDSIACRLPEFGIFNHERTAYHIEAGLKTYLLDPFLSVETEGDIGVGCFEGISFSDHRDFCAVLFVNLIRVQIVYLCRIDGVQGKGSVASGYQQRDSPVSFPVAERLAHQIDGRQICPAPEEHIEIHVFKSFFTMDMIGLKRMAIVLRPTFIFFTVTPYGLNIVEAWVVILALMLMSAKVSTICASSYRLKK